MKAVFIKRLTAVKMTDKWVINDAGMEEKITLEIREDRG
jgi:hypothetical protein